MTIDERTRHQLYLRLEEVLGMQEATTLMEHLPPVGWADVATKTDLRALETRFDLRFDQVDLRFEQVDLRFDQVDLRFEQVDLRFEQIDERFEHLSEQLDLRFDAFGHRTDSRISDLRAETQRDLRTSMIAVIAANAAIVSIIAALTNLF